MPWLKLRTIVLEKDCAAELDAAREDYERFDEAWAGVEWLLARNPTPPGSFLSVSTEDTDFYIYGFRGEASVGIPDMWVFYEFDDDEVVIHGINANDAPKYDEEEE